MSQPTMTQLRKSLIVANFAEYTSSHPLDHKHADSRWERRVYSASGKIQYFIHAYLYTHIRPHLADVVEFETVLYPTERDDGWITIQLHGADVQKAFKFFANAYDKLNCQEDPHNN